MGDPHRSAQQGPCGLLSREKKFLKVKTLALVQHAMLRGSSNTGGGLLSSFLFSGNTGKRVTDPPPGRGGQ